MKSAVTLLVSAPVIQALAHQRIAAKIFKATHMPTA